MTKSTWKRWLENTGKFTLAVLLLFPLSFCGHQPASAQDQYTVKQKNQFLAYENKVYDLIEKGLTIGKTRHSGRQCNIDLYNHGGRKNVWQCFRRFFQTYLSGYIAARR